MEEEEPGQKKKDEQRMKEGRSAALGSISQNCSNANVSQQVELFFFKLKNPFPLNGLKPGDALDRIC